MESLRRLAPAAYCIAALLVGISLVDYLGNAWPFLPGDVHWRYQVVGMLSTYLLSPLLGLLIASIVAAWMPHPLVSRLIGILAVLAALLVLLGLVSFFLDTVQVRSAASPDAKWVTTTSFVLASVKLFAGAVTILLLGVANWRTARDNGVNPKVRVAPVIGRGV